MVKIGILGIGRIEYWNVRYTSLHILVKKKKENYEKHIIGNNGLIFQFRIYLY